ncbi:7281_t:CDS:2 [Ambispora gerdemannii]|uniref:7281_t:CDS:1 n=1 Tax=Ambispora gerdemannii TaxID=144530 RepID=A0A9N9C2C8_9GLOM|nr:7281_t:CDS:2 [Ambispora gerdemannii]
MPELAVLEQGEKGISTKDDSQSPINFNDTLDAPDAIASPLRESSEISDIASNSDVIDLQTENASASNISDITPNSSHFGNDQQKIITNTSLPTEDLDDSDEIELTKNQNIKLDLIRDLWNEPDSLSHEKSSKITTQSLINLFRKAIRSGHEEILSWIHYSDNFENKVMEIRHKTGVSDKTARTQIYKEMLEHLPGVISVALRIKTLRARKIQLVPRHINQVTSKTVSLGNDQNHVISKTITKPITKKIEMVHSEKILSYPRKITPYSDRASYINTILKDHSYLSLRHSNPRSDSYTFDSLGACPTCPVPQRALSDEIFNYDCLFQRNDTSCLQSSLVIHILLNIST